jgi:tRNA nucleotidyltransferase (CCA-adding enzyme)
VWETVADYVRSLDLDAWVVGGAVRDELLGRASAEADFVVPGVGHDELRRLLEPHGRVEDLVVAGQHVGARLHPREAAARALAPKGIEFTPPRVERSTGPGRHDFEIVADASLPLEDDMRRRDFTVNAMARSLRTGELLDPLGGEGDLRAGRLRATSPTSFRDDPLRIVRGLRFVSQLGLDPDEETLRQMREWAPQVRHVSAERIGGGLAADGMGELSKLLLGAQPARALRLARDTGVLTEIVPEFAPAIGFDQESRWHSRTVDEHIFASVQAAADNGHGLAVRLALLLHDLGKPVVAWRGDDGRLHYYANGTQRAHEEVGGDIAGDVLTRLRYPNDVRTRVVRIVRAHGYAPPKREDRVRARKFLARNGWQLAQDLVAHRRDDLLAKGRSVDEELQSLDRFARLLEEERARPHRLADLALDGSDLIGLGFREGPQIGRTLSRLLEEVVEEPERNTREWLERRARELA